MRQFFITMAGVVAGLFVFVGAVVMFVAMSFSAAAPKLESGAATGAVPRTAVLRVDLRYPLLDQNEPSAFGFNQPPALLDIVEAFTRAADDSRVAGAFVRANEYGMAPAQAEEIGRAIHAFQASGKFVVAHAQGFEGTSVTSYLAASAADEIWMQDTSSFVATGLGTETPFFGGVLEKYGAVPEFEQFHEFKNAANVYTEKTFTQAHREATQSLISDIYDSSISLAAEARGLDEAQLKSLIESGPRSAEDALDRGLIDRLGHVVEAREHALELAGADAQFIDAQAYLRGAGRPFRSGPVIALVAGQGAVSTGRKPEGYFASGEGFFSDTIADALLAAADDDQVKAVILRVDSPGGSAIASDQVWHAVGRVKEAGKPVVVSFGSVAASGGYYVAADADAIIANATTITGSIGVLGGKIVFDGTYDLVGFNVEPLSVGGEYTLALSSSQSFTEAQRAAFRAMMADIYDDFTGKVAAGRGMDMAEVLDIAKGRVWAGAHARELGLVDEIGGFVEAVAKAKEMAGLEADASVTLRRFPSAKSTLEQLQELLGVGAESAETLAVLNELRASPEVAALIEARRVSAKNGDTVLYAPITVD